MRGMRKAANLPLVQMKKRLFNRFKHPALLAKFVFLH